MPIGLYLAFVTRPTYGLQGLWIGLIIGMGLLALVLVLQVALLDWEKEARKAEYRLRMNGQAGDVVSTDAASAGIAVRHGEAARGGDLEGGEDTLDGPGIVMNPMGMSRRTSMGGQVALPSIGSRAVGKFILRSMPCKLAALSAHVARP
jgi:hypothetical protein